jgi:Zn-dependent peptidase ImmA (M78 family)
MLAALGLSGRFPPAVLHEGVQRHRGRPVRLIARDLPPPAPHGLLIVTDHADYVFYDDTADPVRRHQIIGHEFGHLLFDDRPAGASWQRSHYEVAAERRAEVFGTVALQHMAEWSVPHADQFEPSTLERIAAALSGRRG